MASKRKVLFQTVVHAEGETSGVSITPIIGKVRYRSKKQPLGGKSQDGSGSWGDMRRKRIDSIVDGE